LRKPISYPGEYHQIYYTLSACHWWFISRCKLITFVIEKHIGSIRVASPLSYIEVGCGTGLVLKAIQSSFPNWHCFGIEGQQEAVEIALNAYPQLQITCGDITNTESSFIYDCIGCFDVLEHITDDSKVLDQLSCMLVQHGLLIITVPQHQWLWSPADDFAGHKRRYNRTDIENKLRKVGFEIVHVTSFVSLLFPLMFGSRLFSNHRKKYNPIDELKISPFLNQLLLWIMSLERLLISLNIKFGFGGSLLIVARKP